MAGIRQRVHDHIEYHGMSNRAFARKAHLPVETIRSILHGVHGRPVEPKAHTLVKLANTMGVSLDYLITGTLKYARQQW